MGVQHLARVLKVVAGEEIDLGEGGGNVFVVDGHFIMHQKACSGGVADTLVLDNDKAPLFLAVAADLERAVEAGWTVVVVFDGATPRGKQGTSKSKVRESGEGKERKQDARTRGAPRAQVQHLARSVVSLSSLVTAKVAKRLDKALRIQSLDAPFEADPQPRLLEEMFTGMAKVGLCVCDRL